MFTRIVLGSLKHRALRVAVAALSVLLGASLVAALASLSLDVGSKAGKELRAYGANLVLAPRTASAQVGVGGMEFGVVQEERYLEESAVAELDNWEPGEVLGYAPFLAGVVEVGERRVPLLGVRFERVRALRPWWAVEGRWVEDQTDTSLTREEDRGERRTESAGWAPAMVGTHLAQRLGLKVGDSFPMRYGSSSLSLEVKGVVETGGQEDGQLFVPLSVAQHLLGKPGLLGSVEVSASAERRSLQAIAREIERRLPGSQVRVVGQIAEAEASTLGKVRMLVGLVAALVLLAAGLAVASTMSASVMERTKEIGLMKALGARNGAVALIFLAEAATISLLGGASGYLLGLGLAQFIGRAVFGAGIASDPLAAPLTLSVALVVCLLASILPVRRAVRVDPALSLRGD